MPHISNLPAVTYRKQTMKRLFLYVLFVLSITYRVSAQTAPDADELTKLLKDFLAGASRNDAAVHDRFWADDLIYTASAGRRIWKADIMRELSDENSANS